MDSLQKTSDFPLLAYADELVEELRTHVSNALKQWDPVAIHQGRVATRRLKAALDLFKPVLSKDRRKPFGKALGRLRRRLGPLRDLDVMLEHLKEFERSDRLAPAVIWLTGQLTQERDEAREASRKQAPPAKVLSRLGKWWGVREEVAEAHEAVDHLLAESLHAQADSFADQANRLLTGRQAKAASAGEHATGKRPAAERVDPHQLRIAGKALRYTLEMASKEGHKLPKETARTFKAMQEHLGLWHDYVVLADRMLTAAIASQMGHHDAETKEAVLDLSKAALRKSSRELERFHQLWADQGDGVTRGIRAAFPLTPAGTGAPEPTESQTGPGPDDSGSSAEPEASRSPAS